MCARDQAEGRIDTILLDLKAAIGEIVGMGGGGGEKGDLMMSLTPTFAATQSNTKPPRGSLSLGKGSVAAAEPLAEVSTLEDDTFREEVARETAEIQSKKRISNGTNNGLGRGKSVTVSVSNSKQQQHQQQEPKPAVFRAPKEDGSSVIWGKLQARLAALHGQWSEARREARRLVLRSVEVHRECRKNLARAKGPSARSHARQDGGGAGGAVSRVRVHQVLGVVPPLSISSLTGVDEGLESEVMSEFGLDLARIHLLQRDLVAFADAAQAWTQQLMHAHSNAYVGGLDQTSNRNGKNNSRGGGKGGAAADDTTASWLLNEEEEVGGRGRRREGLGTGGSFSTIMPIPDAGQQDEASRCFFDPTPLTKQSASAQLAMEDLRLRARELVLHLACLAPLAPLALDSPLASSLTGLEALLSLVCSFPLFYVYIF